MRSRRPRTNSLKMNMNFLSRGFRTSNYSRTKLRSRTKLMMMPSLRITSPGTLP